MSLQAEVVVLGAGPAGYVCAIRLAQLGKKVTVIDRSEVGGVCLNRGCIPSKALLDSSEQYVHAKNKLQKHGILVGEVQLDLAQLMKRKEAVVRQLVNGVAGLFKKNKVEGIQGKGRLLPGNPGFYKSLCQHQRGENVGLEIAAHELDRDPRHGAAFAHAGVVEQDIDVPGVSLGYIVRVVEIQLLDSKIRQSQRRCFFS